MIRSTVAHVDLAALQDNYRAIEEALVLRAAGVRAEILVFGALSLSDLEGLFEHHLTPTCSTPGAGRALGTIPYEVLCRIGSRIERVYD